MAYDPVKAHEYYEKYRKKGKKKGRKRGSGKKESFVGISTYGLNDEGKMRFALIKQNLKEQMNSALANAKTEEEKQKIREEYHNKALQELQKMKSDPNYARPKSTRQRTSQKASQGSKSKQSTSSKGVAKTTGKTKAGTSQGTISQKRLEKNISDLNNIMNNLEKKVSLMSDDQKQEVKSIINEIVEELVRISPKATGMLDREHLMKSLERE